MTKRVSATTITEITASPGFAPPGKESSPPTVSDLEDAIRKDLDNFINYRKNQLKTAPAEKVDRAQQNVDKAIARRQQFEELIKDVPAGFELVPVRYAKITQEENAAIHNEYLKNVRSRFLQFAGENYADDLKALGICDVGIERMKRGLDPADANGRPYETNIDHIIERSGSGFWAKSKETDPDQKAEVEPKFRQNHFGNMILLPEEIHEYKNTLNNLQQIGDLQPGQSKWILMMTPVRDDKQAGFVCPPQQKGGRWDVLRQRPNDPFRNISHAAFTVEQANDRYVEFLENPVVDKALKAVTEVAKRSKKPVVEAAADNRPGKRNLSKIFNDILDHDLKARHHADMNLRPAIAESAKVLSNIFDEVAAFSDKQKAYKLTRNFAEFYEGKNMQKLRERAAGLPFEETLELHQTLKRIDLELAQLKEKLGVKKTPAKSFPAKSFNDNAPRATGKDSKVVPLPVRDNRYRDGKSKDQRDRDAYWANKRRKKKKNARHDGGGRRAQG